MYSTVQIKLISRETNTFFNNRNDYAFLRQCNTVNVNLCSLLRRGRFILIAQAQEMNAASTVVGSSWRFSLLMPLFAVHGFLFPLQPRSRTDYEVCKSIADLTSLAVGFLGHSSSTSSSSVFALLLEFDHMVRKANGISQWAFVASYKSIFFCFYYYFLRRPGSSV